MRLEDYRLSRSASTGWAIVQRNLLVDNTLLHANFKGNLGSFPRYRVVVSVQTGALVDRFTRAPLICLNQILRAGVAKLVYAPDSKSGEVHSS